MSVLRVPASTLRDEATVDHILPFLSTSQPFRHTLSSYEIKTLWSPTHASTGHNDASFMGLPPELRLIIYEELIDSWDFCVRQSTRSYSAGYCSTPLVLLQVCSPVRREVLLLLSAIDEVDLELCGFSRESLEVWLERIDPKRVSQMRQITVDGHGACTAKNHRFHEPSDEPNVGFDETCVMCATSFSNKYRLH